MQNSLLIFCLIRDKMCGYQVNVQANAAQPGTAQPGAPLLAQDEGPVTHVWISTWVINTLNIFVNLISGCPVDRHFLFLGYMDRATGQQHDDAQFGSTGKPKMGEGTIQGAFRELLEETGHKLRPSGRLDFHCIEPFRNSRMTIYSAEAKVLVPGNFQPGPSGNEDRRRRTMVMIYGSKRELIRFARDAATQLRKPGCNPDNIGYFLILSRDDTLTAIRQQSNGSYGGKMVI